MEKEIKRTHAGTLAKSERLKAVYNALWSAGKRGLTTMELIEKTESANISADISDLRSCGVRVLCVYVGLSKAGRKISQFNLWTKTGKRKL